MKPKPTTGIEGELQKVIDHEAAMADMKRLVEYVHAKDCPFLAGISFCNCYDEGSGMKELEKIAMEFANAYASEESSSAAKLVFATLLLRPLKKAWQVGHKWEANTDPKLQERAKAFAEQILNFKFHNDEQMTEALFNLLKEVEDQAWMRLSEARTQKWNELSQLLGVKGSGEVVDAVRALLGDKEGL